MPQLCVYCRKRPADPAWRPFCSERCRLLDLANWVDGRYAVPSEEPLSEDADNASPDAPVRATTRPKADENAR